MNLPTIYGREPVTLDRRAEIRKGELVEREDLRIHVERHVKDDDETVDMEER